MRISFAQAAVDRATSALERAQARLAEARSQLDSARIVLVQAKEHYAELLALSSEEVTAAVANIPNRVGPENFKRSMRLLVAQQPDFITLNEISGRTVEGLRAAAPGYGAYRGGARLTEPGAGGQSINNAVMWRTDAYEVVAQGRIKVVDDDRGYLQKKKFLWDRYATWVTLRNLGDGQVVSVISTHMPTNPAKFPRQWGNPPLTRVQLYARGMDKLARPRRPARATGSGAARRRHELPPQPGLLDGGGEDAEGRLRLHQGPRRDVPVPPAGGERARAPASCRSAPTIRRWSPRSSFG